MKSVLTHLINAQPDRCIDYEQFMKTALYHSETGYYNQPNTKIGKEGDFYTSPSVHPVFGYIMARVFIHFMEKENLPATVCEIGGGNGSVAHAVLNEWKRLSPSTYGNLQYVMVEESSFHRREQAKHLHVGERVIQYANLADLQAERPSFSGILFSNELLDAFPVRVVQCVEGTLYEVKITLDRRGELTEALVLCRDAKLVEWLKQYGFPLQNGQRVEVPLVMTNWLKNVTSWLERGVLLTADYGFTAEEWQRPERKDGSLRGYYRHQLVTNPLRYPGEMDLTSHVHIDAVRAILEEGGMTHLFTVPQREFLLSAGILDELEEHDGTDPFSATARRNRAIMSLISGEPGSAFYTMCHGKALDHDRIADWMVPNPVEEAIKKRR